MIKHAIEVEHPIIAPIPTRTVTWSLKGSLNMTYTKANFMKQPYNLGSYLRQMCESIEIIRQLDYEGWEPIYIEEFYFDS